MAYELNGCCGNTTHKLTPNLNDHDSDTITTKNHLQNSGCLWGHVKFSTKQMAQTYGWYTSRETKIEAISMKKHSQYAKQGSFNYAHRNCFKSLQIPLFITTYQETDWLTEK